MREPGTRMRDFYLFEPHFAATVKEDAAMAAKNPFFGEQEPILSTLKTIAERHSWRSRAYRAAVSGAIAMGIVEIYMVRQRTPKRRSKDRHEP